MEFYFEFKNRKDAYPGNFRNGISLTGCESTQALRVVDECEDKTVYSTKEGAAVDCFHICKDGVTQCYNVFTNTTDELITLDMISSFAVKGICADVIHRATSFWSAEGKLLTQRLVDLNMERAWSDCAYRLEKFGQVGSMPVRKWFPFLVLENSQTGEFVGVQLYCASSWQIEIFRNTETLNICGGVADFDYGHWCKNIAPGESFVTPKAVVATGKSLEDVCDKLVKAQSPDISEVDRDMPVVFNEYCTTWGNPTIENLEKIAKRLHNSGIKYLVMDSGWYKPQDESWWDTVGDWAVNRELFPQGLKPVCDMIKSYGLIPGIWFEFESVGAKSHYFNNKDMLLSRFGVPVSEMDRRFFDMRKPEVISFLTDKVIGNLKDNGFGYVKIDYNANIGVGCDGADSLGEGLRQNVIATQSFFKKMKTQLPELVIENCSSGGHRLEPSMMELSSQASFSDAHECKSIPVIAANLHRLIRPEQSQIWAVMRKDDDIYRINYSLCAGFLGRLCLSGDIFDLSDDFWQNILQSISFYSKIKHIIRDGFTEKIVSTVDSYNNLVGYQLVLRSLGDEALLVVHTFDGGNNPDIDDIILQYHIIDSFGSELDGDYRAKAFYLKK